MSVYKCGDTHWIHISRNGKEIRRSAKTKGYQKAKAARTLTDHAFLITHFQSGNRRTVLPFLRLLQTFRRRT